MNDLLSARLVGAVIAWLAVAALVLQAFILVLVAAVASAVTHAGGRFTMPGDLRGYLVVLILTTVVPAITAIVGGIAMARGRRWGRVILLLAILLAVAGSVLMLLRGDGTVVANVAALLLLSVGGAVVAASRYPSPT